MKARIIFSLLAAIALAACPEVNITSNNTNNNGSGGINAPTPTPDPSPTPACLPRACVTSADCCIAPVGAPEACFEGACR